MSGLDHAIVKHNVGLGGSGELPEVYGTAGYATSGRFLDEYENEHGTCHHKRGGIIGAGVGQIADDVAELKGPNIGAGYEESSENGVKAIIQAETFSTSVSLSSSKKVSLSAKGPNAGAGFEVKDGIKALVKAEAASASFSAGPVKTTVNLSADTGFGIGKSGVEAKLLGTGFSIGRKMGISLFGAGLEFEFGK